MASSLRSGKETRQARNARLAATAAPKVNKFALLSETLLLGVCLFVLALPVVTAPAAFAAGSAHMERHISGRSDSVASLWADFRAALPGSWRFGLVALAAGVVAGINALLAGSEQLPGGTPVLVATVALVAGLAVVLLRTAALWQFEQEAAQVRSKDVRTKDVPATDVPAKDVWSGAWAQAKVDAAGDVSGSVLLLAAMAMAVTFVWMLPPLVFIVPGALVLAVVGVRYRTIAN
ncbi:Poxvirus protein I5 [Specibacter sp. NPDC078692]|uniref:Poxvirus protein I5 n=1 Tax=Specibacter sp. NPDC078692 TaxID=3155818 RepID=UPI0034475419